MLHRWPPLRLLHPGGASACDDAAGTSVLHRWPPPRVLHPGGAGACDDAADVAVKKMESKLFALDVECRSWHADSDVFLRKSMSFFLQEEVRSTAESLLSFTNSKTSPGAANG